MFHGSIVITMGLASKVELYGIAVKPLPLVVITTLILWHNYFRMKIIGVLT